MTYLEELLARTASILDSPAPTATDAVVHDRFDAALWGEVRGGVPAIGALVTDLARDHDYVEDFARDVFMDCVQADPMLRPEQDMAASHLPNRSMVAELSAMPELALLKTHTRGDKYVSAMAMVSLSEHLARVFAAAEDAAEQARQAQEAQEAAQQAAQEAQQAAQAGDESLASEMLELAQALGQAAADGRAEASRSAADAVAGARADLRRAATEAADAAADEAGLMAAFGVEDGELQRMSIPERLALAKRLRGSRLAQFAALIGKFRHLESAARRHRITLVPEEIVGVTLGDDLTRLAPEEVVNMAVPELADDFWLRFVNRELLVYAVAGRERMGQGPIVVVCDESGSMNAEDVVGGSREAWSKALALALADRARAQGRDFHYIGFSSAAQQWSCSLPKGRATLDQTMTMAEHFWGGGTDYERPLSMALDVVESYDERDGSRPDVVFITDDAYGHLDEGFMRRWSAAKARWDVRCFGVSIGCSTSGAVEAVCDDVRSISELVSDPSVMTDVFTTI